MKWLHLSDLHYNPTIDSTDSIYLRDRLIVFLQERQIKVDKIFITGDFLDASCQDDTDKNAENVTNYIFQIADAVGIKDYTNILLVPGNHDVNRYYSERQKCIQEDKKKYSPSIGTLENLDIFISSFEFYKRVLKYAYGESEAINQFENLFKINPHKYNIYDNYNVLLLNTELLSGQVAICNGDEIIIDEGSLITGSRYVINSLSNMRYSKNPTIIIAHRGLDQLNVEERNKLLNIFRDYNVCLYLCGHSHKLGLDNSYLTPQVTVGCIKQDNGVEVGFSIGEFDVSKKLITISAFSWNNDCWKEYTHFCDNGYSIEIDLSNKIHINNDFKNTIKIVIDGRVRVFNCKVNDMKFGVDHTTYMSVRTGELICTIKNNSYSSLIKTNHRFILSDAVWSVIGVDNTSHGISVLTCKGELQGPYDDFISEIASKNLISNFVIELLAPIKNIAKNQEIVIKPMLFRDNKHLENADLIIESSNENIVCIKGGSIIGVSLGEAIIKITWNDDKDICQNFNISVKEKIIDYSTYRLYKYDSSKKSYKDFDARQNSSIVYGIEKFINACLVDKDESFDFIIENKENNNQIEIEKKTDTYIRINTKKSQINSMYILKVISRKTGEELNVDFRIKGLW